MSREDVFEKLNVILREYFDNEDITLKDETVTSDVEGWDSLEHINIISEIEDEFDIKFTMGEITNMKNVGEMVDIILSRI